MSRLTCFLCPDASIQPVRHSDTFGFVGFGDGSCGDAATGLRGPVSGSEYRHGTRATARGALLLRAGRRGGVFGGGRQAEVDSALRRLDNLDAHPSACLLVDCYDDDWSKLWWIRLDCDGRVLADGDERERALDLLATKYAQYRTARPPGPVIALDVTTWRSWP